MTYVRSLSAALSLAMAGVTSAAAQVFNGGGLEGGVDEAGAIQGPVHASLRATVLTLLNQALNFLSLAAVIVIIGAGVYLVVGMGSEESKTKAKTIITYVAVGLVVVYLARSIVVFLTIGLLS